MSEPLCRSCLVRPATVPVALVTARQISQAYLCSECARTIGCRTSASPGRAREEDMAELQGALDQAIETENYERAAVLRDAINELKQVAA